jgi:hypothetical protein
LEQAIGAEHMMVRNIKYSETKQTARMTGEIVMGKKIHQLYFETDLKYKKFISKDSSAFLAAALPLAMIKKEKLEIDGLVSVSINRQLPRIMDIIQSWDYDMKAVEVKIEKTSSISSKERNIGCFFSGGADSFYTYLKNKKSIDTLIFVHGFDIKVDNQELFNVIEKNISEIAKSENKRLIKIKTNIREIFDRYIDWDYSHAFAVSSVSLLLNQGFSEIYASCGLPNKNTDHGSMTPELDPLWSTEGTRIHHYGCDGKFKSLLVE